MHAKLCATASAAVTLSLVIAMSASAQTNYLHNGRHAMPDFSEVNNYERAHQGAPQAVAASQYNTRGRSAGPDFGPVNAYIASNGVAPGIQLADNRDSPRGRSAKPDFSGVNILEAGSAAPVAGSLLAELDNGQRPGNPAK